MQLPRAPARLLAPCLLALACLASSIVVVHDFAPLAGPGDTQVFEYTGYYVAENLKLGLVPSLRLETHQLFYPYGTSAVFQPWGLERDCFYAISHRLLGSGPWLPIYYVLSVLLTGLGGYAIALRDLGRARALVMGSLPALLNFHAIAKYPSQLGYAIVHWSVLSFVADFLIARRVVRRESVGARLLLGRLLLLVLSLGQDLTYVASYGLLSITVSAAFVAALAIWRSRLRGERQIALLWRHLAAVGRELAAAPRFTVGMLLTTAAAAWLYVPLVLEIRRSARAFDFSHSVAHDWWVSPYRLLLPHFPGLQPLLARIDVALGDLPAGGAPEGSPGWFLVLLAIIGLYHARGAWLAFLPTAVVLALCVFYLPPDLRGLKLFPWFAFFRVGGRSTSFYPVLLAVLASGLRWETLLTGRGRLALASLISLGAVEAYTAYSNVLAMPRFHTSASAYDYMAHVRRQDGEAVLDWPFCAVGGNGVGAKLCPKDPRALGIFTLQRFHGKQVLGGYLGRLHPRQVEAYLAAGWDRLIATSDPGEKSGSATECMSSAEWQFFTEFLRLNDFVGINLWVDQLPTRCIDEFRARFGQPTATAVVDGLGRVEFLPKPAAMAAQADAALGATLRLDSSGGSEPR